MNRPTPQTSIVSASTASDAASSILQQSIFLHCGWRCGSTYVWSKFRKLEDTVAFYEPFHESNASYTLESVHATTAQAWNSRHPSLAQPYAAEYLPLLDAAGVQGYREEFAIANYFPGKGQRFAEADYLRDLQTHALREGKIAVFGFSRSLARAGLIKTNFGGHHIVLMRDPIQQWLSCRSYRISDRTCYFELCHFLILALAARNSIAGQFAEELGLPKPPVGRVTQQLAFMQQALEPWSEEFSYRAFLIVYVLSMLSALPHADLVIDMDYLGRSARYRESVMLSCQELTGLTPDFSDCKHPVHDYRAVPVRFEHVSAEILERLIELDIPSCVPVSSGARTQAQSLLMNKVLSAQGQAARLNSLAKGKLAASWLHQAGTRLLRAGGLGA